MSEELNITQSTEWTPDEVPQLTVDVYKHNNTIFIVSTVAGVNPNDLDISVENQTISIKGMRRKPYDAPTDNVIVEECFWGEFYRELTISENLDVDNIKASLKQGVLNIAIPVIITKSQRKIEVSFE